MNKRFTKRSLILLISLWSSFGLFAQQKTVTGTVRSTETQEQLSGVSISIKGGTKNAITDDNGKFSIVVSSDESVLKFSAVGYVYQEERVGAKSTLNVTLAKDNKQLTDVVVVGYGTKKRVNLLGAVSTIKTEEIEDLPVANLGTALVGRVPGINISTTSGKPGASTSLTIRNPTLFAASATLGLTTDPLYVIDGLTVTKQDFDDLDASLVESVSFLKDASAAVYGASADKGVVLVTTKHGKPGKARISYSGYFGNSDATMKPKVLSAYQQAKMLNDGYNANYSPDVSKFSQADLDSLRTHSFPSWYDQLWHSSNLTRHTINVSGGSEKITFFAGGNVYNQDGNFANISIQKYGIRSGMTAKISESVTAFVSLNIDYGTTNRNTLKGSNTETEDLMVRSLFLTPRWVPLTINGLPLNWAQSPNPPGAWNPVALFNSNDYEKTVSQGLSLNSYIEYKPNWLKGLTAKVQYGKINRSGTSKQYFPSYLVYNFVRSGQNSLLYSTTPTTSPSSKISNTDRLQEGTSYENSYQLFASLDYMKKFGKHEIDILALTEQRENIGDNYLTYRNTQQIPNIDQFFAFDQSTTTVQLNGADESGKRSYLGRLNYTYDNKYLLEVITRFDASANFAPANRWGLFPAVSAGWKVNEEKFFRNIKFINTLKLRASVGLTGDDRVSTYQYISRFTQATGMLFGSTLTSGLDPSIYPNPDITWERALNKNYGIDATFLNSKINFTVDIWNRKTYDGFDDLATVAFPYTFGANVGLKNYGIQNNWGTEWSLGYRGTINRDWQYSVDVNLTTSHDLVIQKYYNPGQLGTATQYQNVNVGESSNKYNSANYGYISLGILRTQADVDALLSKNPNYKINGVKPQVGFLNFVDINHDGLIDGNDIVPMYDNTAALFGAGITLGVTYKTFKLNTNIGLNVGGKVFVDAEARKVPTTNQNAPDFWADHWTPDNPNAKYPRADAPLAKENSTFWELNGTSARINNMTLSYAMPKRLADRFRIPDFRAFVSAINLLNIINPYSYKDPQTSNFATYPTLRTLSLGLNITL